MRHAGFTIVELIVAITIMGILFTIGTISFTNSQIDSRDGERQADTENLARHLESYYTNNLGRYPVTTVMGTESTIASTLPGIATTTQRAPGAATGTSIVVATNAVQTAAGVLPQPTISQYVYQPIATDNTLCTTAGSQECRSYTLYYREERTNTVVMVKGLNR